jgi:beta-lactamase regulating signal transducer with metallopeptidase domain
MTEIINGMGREFCDHAATMFIQTGVLVAVLLGIDLLLRSRVRATLRYWIWMLVFAKLLLPPSLCAPTGIGYWLGRHASLPAAVSHQPVEAVATAVRTEADVPAEMPVVPASSPLSMTGVPTASATANSESLTWQGDALLFWGVGVLVFTALVVQRLLFVCRLIRQTEPAQGNVVDVLYESRRQMGIRQRVGLRLSQSVCSPAVCGLLRPTIVMPAAMLDRLSPESLKAVLIHELVHVKRGDVWVNSLQMVLQIIYFYNPLVWLANAIVRRVREQAVDEMVLVALGAQARSYGNTLIDIAEMAFLRVSPALRLIGVAESRKSLEGRIKHMMTRPIPKSARIGLWGFVAVFMAGAVLLPMAKAQRTQENAAQSGGHRVSAIPLADFERTLVGQVLDLVKEVEKRYPDQSTHRPAGPGLYHIDSEGQVTVWHYRKLWRRSNDCAEDEVGWGSSESVHATGMYYLPDGTPLQSRWRERGNGMKDIRVKIGRTIGEDERVAVIHRHRLSDERELLSRHDQERTILLDSQEDAPVAIVVRVDRPMRLTGWWIADAAIDRQDLDDYDQLTVTGSPQMGGAPMLVRVMLAEGQVHSLQADLAMRDDEASARLQSAEALAQLGKASLIYTVDHQDWLPDRIEDLPDNPGLDKAWLIENVVYLGTGMKTHNDPDSPVAYDKTLLLKGQGTNVLSLDTQVVFEGPELFATLASRRERVERYIAPNYLRELAIAANRYAEDHGGSFARDMSGLKTYMGDEDRSALVATKVEYLAAGAKANQIGSTASTRPLAYWKTGPATVQSTAVVFFDAHVEFIPNERLAEFGITVPSPVTSNSGEAFRSYEVNRSVADFPAREDFSTPEAAYAAVNRMNWEDSSAWQRVSAAASAAQIARDPAPKGTMDPEWAKVLQNARIREVIVWNMTRAAVIAELPQGLSGKQAAEPVDRRSFQLENGRWLNTGESRFESVEEAKAQFMEWMKREASQQEAMRDPLRHAGEIKEAAAQLFERLRTADYATILAGYRDGKWDSDVWRKFPTHGLYTVQTDYPSFALWCCTHFKDNPIVSVRLGDVFIGDALVIGRTGWPTVPYKLMLKDGTVLAGNLPFNYDIDQGQGHWHAIEGIDWHLWPGR